MDAGISEAITTGLTGLFTALFGYIAYTFSSKSRCSVCNDYLPVRDLRWSVFVTNPDTGKLEEKSCCNKCFQAGAYTLPTDKSEVRCVRCGVSIGENDGDLLAIDGETVRACDHCISLPVPTSTVALQDLLSPEFLSSRTSFESFDDLADRYSGQLNDEADLHTYEFDAFIRDNSGYAFFRDMLEDAKELHRTKMLKRHFRLEDA